MGGWVVGCGGREGRETCNSLNLVIVFAQLLSIARKREEGTDTMKSGNKSWKDSTV